MPKQRMPRSVSSGPSKRESVASCRFCRTVLTTEFVDLGMSPLCQSHISPGRVDEMEEFYPLKAYVCGNCFLVQLAHRIEPSKLFTDYAYLSSYSSTWVEHARKYVE